MSTDLEIVAWLHQRASGHDLQAEMGDVPHVERERARRLREAAGEIERLRGLLAAERARCAKIAEDYEFAHECNRDAALSIGSTPAALTQARQSQTAHAIAAAIRAGEPGETQ